MTSVTKRRLGIGALVLVAVLAASILTEFVVVVGQYIPEACFNYHEGKADHALLMAEGRPPDGARDVKEYDAALELARELSDDDGAGVAETCELLAPAYFWVEGSTDRFGMRAKARARRAPAGP